jgi:acyl-CoA synthetase (AMP-forming)/AMP-acid ligase II
LHPDIRTLSDIPSYWSRRTPEKVAICAGPATISYAQLDDDVAALSAVLTTSKSNVGFIGRNVPEFWTIWFAAGRAGRPFVPFNWRSPAPELTEVVADAAPGVIFVDRQYERAIAEVVERLGFEVEVIPFVSVSSGGAGLCEWVAAQPVSEAARTTTSEDIALLAYTSGTTGRPKGVMVRHEAFDLAFLSDDLEPTITWSPEDIVLMAMPNFHLAGSWVPLPALYHGGTVAMLPAFEPKAFLAAVRDVRPTVACLVPSAIQSVLDVPEAAPTDFASLRTLIYAGSPMPVATMDRALAVIGCELRQFYGTTESYIISLLRPDDHTSAHTDVKASCGKPIPLVRVRVVDQDGRDVVDGEIGHVVVRSPMLMAGYYGQPEATSEVVRDGWYWTGDLGYRSLSGHYFLVDRAKDMIVTGGENVYSVEVERALQQHPDVALAAVIGTPDERWVEAVTAFVLPKDGARDASTFGEELKAHCRHLIATYKVPKRVQIVDHLPMTPSGKVRKSELRKLAEAALTGRE